MIEDSSYSAVYKVDGEYFLYQGDADEGELQMWRHIDDLLECERDNVQKMMPDYESDYE